MIDVLAPRLGWDRRETPGQTGTAEGAQYLAALSSTLAQFGRAIRASIDLGTKLDGAGTADSDRADIAGGARAPVSYYEASGQFRSPASGLLNESARRWSASFMKTAERDRSGGHE